MLYLTGGTGDRELIDLQTAEYSDDDLEIHFKVIDVIEYLFKIEEDNLFNINLCQNDEQQLEEEAKKAQDEILVMENKIKEQ